MAIITLEEQKQEQVEEVKKAMGHVGVKFRKQTWSDYRSRRYIAFCSCGVKTEYKEHETTICTCGNKSFKTMSRPSRNQSTIVGGIFELVSKDDKSFHLRKIEVTAKISVENYSSETLRSYSIEFINGKNFDLTYDIRRKEVTVSKEDVLLEDVNEANLNDFFTGYVHHDFFVNLVSTEKNKKLYDLGIKSFGHYHIYRKGKGINLGSALMNLIKYPSIELFDAINFTNMYMITQNDLYLKSKLTRPHEILGVPKYLFNIIKEMPEIITSQRHIDYLIKLDKRIDGNSVKSLIEIGREESSISQLFNNLDNMLTLFDDYGYKDLKRLSLYLFREVKVSQGLDRPSDAISLLRDYARMSKDIELPFEKYPDSLKKVHDVVTMNYKTFKDAHKDLLFRRAVENYADLRWEIPTKRKKKVVEGDEFTLDLDLIEDVEEVEEVADELFEDEEEIEGVIGKVKPVKYCIITPSESGDLLKEGSDLSHCLASYVNNVIEGKCRIVFLRDKNKIKDSIVSIEVRDDNIRQARGKCNRTTTSEEALFIEKWAKIKGLTVAYH